VDDRIVMTVLGPVSPADIGIADGHTHTWIEPVAGADPAAPVLGDLRAISADLRDYRQAGGRTQIDCQPGGCGRNGRKLRELALASSVHIVACTGFHLRRYYAPDYWLWEADAQAAYAYFRREILQGLEETQQDERPVRAGFIKIAFEADVATTPAALLDAVAEVAQETGVAVEIHTERGAGASAIVSLFEDRGLSATRLMLCHMDKRPEIDLHRALCQRGVMLEYDTFFRPKYEPERNVWPLLEQMLADGLEGHIVLATDQADARLWQRLGGGPGPVGFISEVIARLRRMGAAEAVIQQLAGGNVAECLAHPPLQ
jgi:phosphotriesterase-related protein